MNSSGENNRLACEIVRDLLPLYHDGVVSDSTKAAVKEHLEQCPSCRKEHQALDIDLPVEAVEVSTQTTFLNMLRWQKRSVWLKTLFFLSAFSLLLPWFTYNAEMIGYRTGLIFLDLFLPPLLLVAVRLFTPTGKFYLILTELGLTANLVNMVLAFGLWHERCNILTGFKWAWHTIQPGYWVSAALFLLLFVFFQYDLWKTHRCRTQQP